MTQPFWMKAPAMEQKTPPAPLPAGPAVTQADAEAPVEEPQEILPAEAMAVFNVQGIAASTVYQLKTEFRSAFGDAQSLLTEAAQIRVTDESQASQMMRARELRLKLKQIRCSVERVRKDAKADSLLRGKVIDGVANALKGVIEPAEGWLLEQEEFAARAEQKRIDQLRQERAAAIAPYLAGPVSPDVDLAYLTIEAWDSMLEGAKLLAQHREEVARQEADARRQKEEADRAERERLQAENDRLRKEQEAKDAENRRLREEAERAQREECERKASEERARLKKEAEEKAAAARLAEIERKAASAPDKEKALAYLDALRAVPMPAFTSEAGKRVSADIVRALDGFCKVIEQGVNNEL